MQSFTVAADSIAVRNVAGPRQAGYLALVEDKKSREIPPNEPARPLQTDRDPNVVTSMATGRLLDTGMHYPVIDIDHPVRVVPSSTAGHGHLYIDVPLAAADYAKLLAVMVEVGLVEQGFVNRFRSDGFTAVRLPWIRKPDAELDPGPVPVPPPY